MKRKIGILFGSENSFPSALSQSIQSRNAAEVEVEYVEVGAQTVERLPRYAVVVDRISHEVPFYRAWLKAASLAGTIVLNNPFWASADDKFFGYALAERLGILVPRTVLLPHKLPPGMCTDQSLRNLQFPLDWERVFATVGEHGYLKPVDGRGGRAVTQVHGRADFFRHYDESGTLAMLYQQPIRHEQYFRCLVIGQKRVRIMPWNPELAHEQRYLRQPHGLSQRLERRIHRDAVRLTAALGYDVNTVEFAVADGVPYAIDFMNPVPDGDVRSIGEENFNWFVEQMADLAIQKALVAPAVPELRAAAFLTAAPPARRRMSRKRSAAASS